MKKKRKEKKRGIPSFLNKEFFFRIEIDLKKKDGEKKRIIKKWREFNKNQILTFV